MKLFLPTILFLSLVVPVLRAEPTFQNGRLVLEKQSYFDPGGRTRNPCWPIGFTPRPKVAGSAQVEVVAVVEIPAEALEVTLVMLGSPPIAIVNGRELTLGDTLQVQVGKEKPIPLKVVRIGDGFVDFDNAGTPVRAKKQ